MPKNPKPNQPALDDVFPGLTSSAPERLSTGDTELFSRHFAGDAAARNEIVERYFGLIEVSVESAIKVIREAIADGDLMQAGALGFLEAVNAYKDDPRNRDRPFEDFCAAQIRSAVMRELIHFVGETEEPGDVG